MLLLKWVVDMGVSGVIILMGERFLIAGNDTRYKIILVGDVSVGKTALFWRFTEGEFLTQKDTTVTTIDFKMKGLTIGHTPVKLYVWDTAGSEKYRSIVSTYFKGCHGVVITFDISKKQSYDNAIDMWYPLAQSKSPNSCYVLVGNKSDLKSEVNRSEVEEWCKAHKTYYVETSVKENKNVNDVFESLARKIYASENLMDRAESISLRMDSETSKKDKCCG